MESSRNDEWKSDDASARASRPRVATGAIVCAFLLFAIGLICAVFGRLYERFTLEAFGVLGGIGGLIMFFVGLAMRTDIIRDATAVAETPAPLKPYSLARTQLAYWTILVVAAYAFIWAIEGEPPLIEGSTLALLGISVATTTGARLIDLSQSDRKNRSQDAPSDGFFTDILSDPGGVSIHRFQMVVWSLALGAVFIEWSISQHEIKQFPDELLALLGISNGAYLGLKIPENKGS